ncbi:hypothetical protein ACLOJK_029296 [Asimina triloba]
MESILSRALEYTLRYWLKSFSRDQCKLQGRTVQLSNLDINGDVLHASLGLPLALNVSEAKVGKLEIKLPYVSNVQIEPIVVQIDRLDLVLEEKLDSDGVSNVSSNQSSTTYGKGSGYGFADKVSAMMSAFSESLEYSDGPYKLVQCLQFHVISVPLEQGVAGLKFVKRFSHRLDIVPKRADFEAFRQRADEAFLADVARWRAGGNIENLFTKLTSANYYLYDTS